MPTPIQPQTPGAFTTAQLELLAGALRMDGRPRMITREQREVLRRIRGGFDGAAQSPEKMLVAFKIAVRDAADHAGIAYGHEREDIIGQLVSGFIEEIFRDDGGDGARIGADAAG